MLINWFLSTLPDKSTSNQKFKNSELYLLAVQFCTQLLSAGVIQQIIDKDAAKEEIFKVSVQENTCTDVFTLFLLVQTNLEK